ncbi:class I SAM-dependent methyltransferase [Sphingorhabdus soli]|uniref:Class I SAM-dependent methyltransferase n=1 Tax=Flavisphingopyxis soli TaxID=2601267 RepID=A0A5C6UKQ0_9SPHN|nr:class I SAM-dependent methyltransferase [Sphingorhabdus soli]
MRRRGALLIAAAGLALALPGCDWIHDPQADRPETAREFPRADRPVAPVVSNQYSDENNRDRLGEAVAVMDRANIVAGMTVADIGAGEGYYTVRLGQRVGSKGRVLAQDIDRGAIRRLADRVARERLDNVSIKLGAPDDPKLPAASFDRIFMVHMYHEIAEPYAFLWRLRPALRAGGQVIVIDADRPTTQHGTPPKLLFCEFEAVGYKLAEFTEQPGLGSYYASFEASGDRPDPGKIEACKSSS